MTESGGGARASSRPSLARLRELAREAREASDLLALEEQLAGDPRRGAQDLAGRCRRRREAIVKEARRMDALFALRRELAERGVEIVAGVDEVGVGPLAGPVVAAAVILPDPVDLRGLDDSKRLTPEQRERLATAIRGQARAWAIGEVDAEEIDRVNIYQAGLLAMARAVAGLSLAPQHLLVDARRIPGTSVPQTSLLQGDSRDASIAAASVVAKVHRDALMVDFDARYPGYGLARHKGYPTDQHLAALREHGPTPIHRRSFAPVAQLSRG